MTATEERPVQILELFGGIGSPRCALRNLKIPTKAIDYVEIDEKAVRSYNNMFSEELLYKTQSVVGWNLKPDILIHGSPCQDFSIAGHQRGADEGSETRSSLMWETIHIIDQMGEWKPKYVIWENVKNVTSKYMIANFVRYQKEMERMGYLHLCNSTMHHLLSCYIHTARRHLYGCPLQCSEGRGNGNKKATAHFCTIASCNFPRYQFTSFIPPLKPQLFPNFSPKRKAKRISF